MARIHSKGVFVEHPTEGLLRAYCVCGVPCVKGEDYCRACGVYHGPPRTHPDIEADAAI